MQRNPVDIFDEMDELFDQLFGRMNMGYGFADPFSGSGHPEPMLDKEAADMPGAAAELPPDSPAAPEVQRVGDEVRVIAAVPGIDEEALRLIVRKGTLIIDAGDAEHHIHHTVPLPPADPAPLRQTLRNGVLEVSFRAITP